MVGEDLPPWSPGISNVLVIDPYPVSRGAVAALLRCSGLAGRVYEAALGGEALETVRGHGVALVVLATEADRPHGVLSWCRRLKRLPSAPAVLIYSGNGAASFVAACLASGADGMVHRSATERQLLDAVRDVIAGRPVWPPGHPAREGDDARDLQVCAPPVRMTQREEQIFALLLHRYSNDEIAAELHLARQTVKNHVSSVLHKTGFANRRELAKAAARHQRAAAC
ncbi:DNA-binding response regulator [Sphaerisporangium melleum]|uniref:DNA-binding response regulator n=1 Tax=Sphaerisporangium melleum TaxID=321316 RepID=A0A917R4B4_9ACTN|nr:response regulator transcription factor [Sphaerisporangium melleum]GGK87829.1 DNA-binding response regulator [Sphaerisporangium melleum]GII72450.1 DNA-binding response regulator [Sphaerisporangium melleum]